MKKLLSFLLILCMTFSSFSSIYAADLFSDNAGHTAESIKTVSDLSSKASSKAGVSASSESGYLTQEWVQNPLYPNLPQKKGSVKGSTQAASKNSYFITSTTQGGEYIRPLLVARASSMEFSFNIDNLSILRAVVEEIIDIAMEHTGVSNEGDYIRWHWTRWAYSGSYSIYNGLYRINLTLNFEYYTNNSQEQQMTARTNQVVNELGLKSGLTAYQKTKKVYDYVTSHVTYDYAHLNDMVYGLQQTAYAALLHGTSVCQGYATLIYRLLLEAGVDCRVITSIDHAWNIVGLGKYYNIDATWDAGRSSYNYFLLSDANFTDSYSHVREYPWNTQSFYQKYPMGTTNYVPTNTPCTHSWGSGVVTKAATCTEPGSKKYNCSLCGASKTETIPAKGHTEVKVEGRAATCTVAGLTEGKKCSVCNTVTVAQQQIPALGHNYVDYICTRCNEISPDYVAKPAAPVLKNVSNISTGVKLEWQAATGTEGIINYKIYRDGKYLATAKSTATSYTDKTAVGGKKYSYAVAVKTDGGLSDKSSSKSIIYLKQPTLKLTNQNGSVKLTWNKITGAKKYEVWVNSTKVTTVTGTSYTYKTTKTGTTFTFKVKAVNGSYSSSVASAKIKYLARPTVTSIKKSGKNLKITWKKVSGASSYQVWRKEGNGSWKKIATTSSLSYTDKYNDSSKLTKNKKYSYSVKAVSGTYVSALNTTGKTYTYK